MAYADKEISMANRVIRNGDDSCQSYHTYQTQETQEDYRSYSEHYMSVPGSPFKPEEYTLQNEQDEVPHRSYDSGEAISARPTD
jgi:hypothetical protein